MSVNYLPHFDSPINYVNKFDYFFYGSSPNLLTQLGNYFHSNEGLIDEIYISLYLYNNLKLHEYFKSISKQGIKISVVSIPLEGYDISNPKMIRNHKDRTRFSFQSPITKYDIANIVYSDYIKNKSDETYRIFVFPHMFIRSEWVYPFSRGKMPYSLHTKNGLIKFKNGGGAFFLSSSNFAVRDLVKEENLIIVENYDSINHQLECYFSHLLENSINLREFDHSKNYFNYPIKAHSQTSLSESIIIAPFYSNSPINAENKIKHLIDNAKNRIYICAQHISCYTYEVDNRYSKTIDNNTKSKNYGFLYNLLQKAEQGVEVKVLSQTFIDEKGDSHGCRKPANSKSFMEFIDACKNIRTLSYYVNEDVHNKYIIIDEYIIITTFNYTPTQFIYLSDVKIEQFIRIPNLKYEGIFSEVGQMIVLKDDHVLDKYITKYNEICSRNNTYRHL